jgi:undecaprenyl-diphosphatase
MKHEENHHYGLYIPIVFFILFCLPVISINMAWLNFFDQTIMSFVQGMEKHFLTNIMLLFTTIGSFKFLAGLSIVTVMVLLYKVQNHSEFLLFFVVVLGTPVLNHSLKELFHRIRPDLHPLIEIGGYSFSSGHAMNSFAIIGIITFFLWKHLPLQSLRIALLIVNSGIIFLIGINRIYLGVHYPSDILGGYLASGCWLFTSIWLLQKIWERKSKRKLLLG